MRRTFEIEFPDDCGPMWMNNDNLLLCLDAYCPNTPFRVRDVTPDENAAHRVNDWAKSDPGKGAEKEVASAK